tara:strand:+ start:330 stop:1571 length:1242 start_codon:yes stop_codon:yes gene_type:complete
MNRKIILMVILACLMGLTTYYLTNYLMGGKILQQNVKSIKGKHKYRNPSSTYTPDNRAPEICDDYKQKHICDDVWTPYGKCVWEDNKCTCDKCNGCESFENENACYGQKSPDGEGECEWYEESKICKLKFKLNTNTIKQAVKEFKDESYDFNSPKAEKKYGPISDWDVSGVTSMFGLFYGCTEFNKDISSWDVSNVTNMSQVFYNCSYFNQPIGGWNVSKVTNMNNMFKLCVSFKQDISNWKVFNVTSMYNMFYGCTTFNQPIGDWDVSSVTNMGQMFYGCTEFNQPIGGWYVSKVTNMLKMFYGCTAFDQAIGSWDVSNVTNMYNMFYLCEAFKQDISKWDVRSLTRGVVGMFDERYDFPDEFKPKVLKEEKQRLSSYLPNGKPRYICGDEGILVDQNGGPLPGNQIAPCSK